MTGLWLVSYLVLWLIVIISGLTIIALAREIEDLHKYVDSLRPYLSQALIDVQESEKEN